MRLKKRMHAGITAVPALLAGSFFFATARANSSWKWISDARPYALLPWVALGTLLIETRCIDRLARVYRPWKVLLAVALGNGLSFMAPYGLEAWIAAGDKMYSFVEHMEHMSSIPPRWRIGCSR